MIVVKKNVNKTNVKLNERTLKTTYAAPEGIYYGQWLARRSVTDGGFAFNATITAVTSPQKSRGCLKIK